MYRVGFTGGRRTPTAAQKDWLADVFAGFMTGRELELHHGDCVGKDEYAHKLALAFGWRVVIHPPENDALRAYCTDAYLTLDEAPYMERNQNIVYRSNILVAVPDFPEGLRQRSGTWATVRMARKAKLQTLIYEP